MLILRRRVGEKVEIGEGEDKVVLIVLEIRTRSEDVNLGFENSTGVLISRPESAERVRRRREGNVPS